MKDFFPNYVICCSSITGSLDIYILKFKKNHDFARLVLPFALRNFKKWRQNLYFRVSKIALQLVIFHCFRNHLTKSLAHWPHYGVILESSKCLENKNGKNYRNQNTRRQLFANYCNASKILKQV